MLSFRMTLNILHVKGYKNLIMNVEKHKMLEDFNPLIICSAFFFPPRVGTIESSALKCLREKIYAHRAELTSAFAQYDLNGTGNTTLSSCHHGESSFHVRVGAEGTNTMEMGPASSVRLEGSTGWLILCSS